MTRVAFFKSNGWRGGERVSRVRPCEIQDARL